MVYIREWIDGHIVDVPYEKIDIPKDNISMIAKTLDNRTAIFVDGIVVIVNQDFETVTEDWYEHKTDDTIE